MFEYNICSEKCRKVIEGFAPKGPGYCVGCGAENPHHVVEFNNCECRLALCCACHMIEQFKLQRVAAILAIPNPYRGVN